MWSLFTKLCPGYNYCRCLGYLGVFQLEESLQRVSAERMQAVDQYNQVINSLQHEQRNVRTSSLLLPHLALLIGSPAPPSHSTLPFLPPTPPSHSTLPLLSPTPPSHSSLPLSRSPLPLSCSPLPLSPLAVCCHVTYVCYSFKMIWTLVNETSSFWNRNCRKQGQTTPNSPIISVSDWNIFLLSWPVSSIDV